MTDPTELKQRLDRAIACPGCIGLSNLILLLHDCRSLIEQQEQQIGEMLDDFERLGNSPTARIDAREWHKYFKRKVRK